MRKSRPVATVGTLIFGRETWHTPTDRDSDDSLRVIVESQLDAPYLKMLAGYVAWAARNEATASRHFTST